MNSLTNKECEESKTIIYGLAYKYSHTLCTRDQSISIEDLIQDGYSALFDLLKKKKEGKLSVPLIPTLSKTITNWFNSKYESLCRPKKNAEVEEFVDSLYEDANSEFQLVELMGEAREVAELIINAPQEFIDLCKEMSFNTALVKYLRRVKKWESKKVKSFLAMYK
jgi:hypothetical protein